MKYLMYVAQAPNIDTSKLPKPPATLAQLDDLLGVAFGILGAIAVLVIAYGGFRYVISRGDPREMARAKDIIIYALIGLAVCILAFSIVTFVIRSV